jgi:hypothetical protein
MNIALAAAARVLQAARAAGRVLAVAARPPGAAYRAYTPTPQVHAARGVPKHDVVVARSRASAARCDAALRVAGAAGLTVQQICYKTGLSRNTVIITQAAAEAEGRWRAVGERLTPFARRPGRVWVLAGETLPGETGAVAAKSAPGEAISPGVGA